MQPKRAGFEYYLHALFEAGVALKAFNGLWETVSGLFVLLVPRQMVMHWFSLLAQKELIEDPHDRFVDIASRFITNTPEGTRLFIAIYILAHGILNLFLAYQLYRQRLWAFPVTATVVGVFILYQLERVYQHHSVTLIVLTILDIIFLALLMHEYKHQRSKSRAA